MIGISLAIGVLFVIPIGGADMPVVISLLNSYAGLAASATGFAIGNNVLIICGALDGASRLHALDPHEQGDEPLVLERAVRRVRHRRRRRSRAGRRGSSRSRSTTDDAALQLAYAQKVVIIPGYGMAVAQSQHQVRELADLIEKRGGDVKYAIHPVAGRMPGHLNVILADAGVDYERLLTDVDDANRSSRAPTSRWSSARTTS